MSRSHVRVYLHLVWATCDRLPLIEESLESKVYACIGAKATELNCDAIAIGGVKDHVHTLVRFPATVSIATLVKEMKGASSHLVTHGLNYEGNFRWQGSYGAFSVGTAEIDRVADYVQRQKAHHARRRLVEEWEKTG